MISKIFYLFTLVFTIIFMNANVVYSQQLPITSTFVAADMNFTTEVEYQNMINEMKATGIDTIIIPIADVDCGTNGYIDYYYLEMAGRAEPIIVLSAIRSGVKVYFSLQSLNVYKCLNPFSGKLGDLNTDKGHIINSGLVSIDKAKEFMTKNGISWDNPLIAGFYISQESSTADIVSNSSVFEFYRDYSQKIKAKEPSKLIMLSQFQSEDTDYLTSFNAFKKLYAGTSIDVLAPQDSMGSGLTYTIASDKEHFRALKDALIATGGTKQAWANIEIFKSKLLDPQYRTLPAPVSRVVQQISAARPYVTKMTTWIYQYSLLITEASRNSYDPNKPWTIMYTPDLFDLRKVFRIDYLNAYGGSLVTPTPVASCISLFYCDTSSYTCKSTSSKYDPISQMQCGTNISCSQNLKDYHPGSTTGLCYTTSNDCLSECKAPVYLDGDINLDSKVDEFDYKILVSEFGLTGNKKSDITKDGKVDIFDYNVLVGNYGKSN